jgi:hypothetical protein
MTGASENENITQQRVFLACRIGAMNPARNQDPCGERMAEPSRATIVCKARIGVVSLGNE